MHGGRSSPQFARGYLQLVMSLNELGQYDQVAAIGSQLVSVASAMRERERYRTLGVHYLVIRDYRNAREQYETLLKAVSDVIGHNNLAVIRFYQRDCSGALQAIPQAVEIFPQQVVYRHNYALFAMYASDFDTAAAVLASMTSSSVSFSNARPSKPPLI